MKTVRLIGIDSDLPMLMYPYEEITDPAKLEQIPQHILLSDHLGGFDKNYRNPLLDILQERAEVLDYTYNVDVSFLPNESMLAHYNRLNLIPGIEPMYRVLYKPYENHRQHIAINHTNFLCSFNGSQHISRQLLLANIYKRGWVNLDYVSKNFAFTEDALDGNIDNLTGDRASFYKKFFIGDTSSTFFAAVNNFGSSGPRWLESNDRFNHARSLLELESKLTSSFVHLVSETIGTSNHPYVTEKYVSSIVTRGLFLAFAQPRWHQTIQDRYGFKLYTRIFDYKFDTVVNPVERIIALTDMLSKFKNLSLLDWRDLYLLESDTIEYNYDHFFSKSYLKRLAL
jgi:hypothetical protein